MQERQGEIKISSENMMPIIKKWLYSDKDIFLRELVANGVDAITKWKKLVEMGEANGTDEPYKVVVSTDEKAKTLTIEDNGLGMSEEEVEKYITQIAFSGAHDFLQKYEKSSGDGIIGHFGLGFYSAYMVADEVEIITKSYQNTPAVHWVSDGNSTYTIKAGEKETRGTKIVLHLSKAEKEFAKESVVKELLKKYCAFMPYDVYLNPKGAEDKPVNDKTPLYLKDPKACTDEEYKSFYQKTFMDYEEPLFWIHLNMEYPFRLQGILYFPRVKKQQVQLEKGQVKLYCNQVFIADNIKEVIPEFLMLLNGVIDCPDIPLNVSRSFLQNDAQVQKISKHITKKVADKLVGLFKNDRKRYEECWKDISTFIKFGCMKDESFYEKVKDVLIFKNLSGDFKTLQDCMGEEVLQEDMEKGVLPKAIYYVSDEVRQAQYIAMFKEAGLDALLCDTLIDSHFLSFIEYKHPKKCRFVRIDAEVDGALKGESLAEEEGKTYVELFQKYLEGEKVTIKVEKLSSAKLPALVNVEEFMRRMTEMQGLYGSEGMDEMLGATLIVNANNPLVQRLPNLDEGKQKLIVKQIYYLAMLAFKPLSAEQLSEFVDGSVETLSDYSK